MTAEELLNSIQNNEEEVSPSTIFAVASILEGCTYINGSPQNTFVPGKKLQEFVKFILFHCRDGILTAEYLLYTLGFVCLRGIDHNDDPYLAIITMLHLMFQHSYLAIN